MDRFSRKRTTSIPLLKVKVDKTFKNVRFLPHLQASSAAGQSNVCKIWRFLHFPRRPIQSADRLLDKNEQKLSILQLFSNAAAAPQQQQAAQNFQKRQLFTVSKKTGREKTYLKSCKCPTPVIQWKHVENHEEKRERVKSKIRKNKLEPPLGKNKFRD